MKIICGDESFSIDDYGHIRYQEKIWILDNDHTKVEKHVDLHNFRFLIHNGETKMYYETKQNFWWPN